jgi:hypothetical protein
MTHLHLYLYGILAVRTRPLTTQAAAERVARWAAAFYKAPYMRVESEEVAA